MDTHKQEGDRGSGYLIKRTRRVVVAPSGALALRLTVTESNGLQRRTRTVKSGRMGGPGRCGTRGLRGSVEDGARGPHGISTYKPIYQRAIRFKPEVYNDGLSPVACYLTKAELLRYWVAFFLFWGDVRGVFLLESTFTKSTFTGNLWY